VTDLSENPSLHSSTTSSPSPCSNSCIRVPIRGRSYSGTETIRYRAAIRVLIHVGSFIRIPMVAWIANIRAFVALFVHGLFVASFVDGLFVVAEQFVDGLFVSAQQIRVRG
jgi:hypothetical protein